jgi:hypothetical protein
VGEVLDVVVLADHEAVLRLVAPVDRAMDLEDHGVRVRRQLGVLVGALDEPPVAVGRTVDEAAAFRAAGHVDDNVVGLRRLVERPLHNVVVVGGDDELVAAPIAVSLEGRGQRSEEAVEGVRRVVGVEDIAQVLVQRALAAGQVDVLGDANEIGAIVERVAELIGEEACQFRPAGRVAVRVPGRVWRPVAEVRARPE